METPQTSTATLHEDLSRRAETGGASDRTFGLVIGVVLVGLSVLARRRFTVVSVAEFGAGCALITAALWRPAVLRPLNRAWTKLGLLLGMIVTPVIMSVVYFLFFPPVAILYRRIAHHQIRVRPSPAATTYWIDRRPPGPPSCTMTRQF